jgi:NAD(P)-dependent dehydrogenase (short-subunit alcohol dehydrogenase family)
MSDTSPRKTVLVTGAARRIGREIALTFGRHGWNVAVHYATSQAEAEDTAAQVRALGVDAIALGCDLDDEAAVNGLLARVVDGLGRVDAVVNNASRFEYDDAGAFNGGNLQRHLGSNLIAPIVLARDLAARLRAEGPQARGVVVNLLDQKLWNYNPDFLSYSLTKAALEAATTMLAQALAPTVRVLGVAPGLTLISHLQTPEGFANAHKLAPLGQASRPEDIAQAVLFAATNPAMTGTTLLVDGGQHLMGFARDFSMMNPADDAHRPTDS